MLSKSYFFLKFFWNCLQTLQHGISDAPLIGGGHVLMPDEVSLAHRGILFLDERPECRRHGLEVLRLPLEDAVV